MQGGKDDGLPTAPIGIQKRAGQVPHHRQVEHGTQAPSRRRDERSTLSAHGRKSTFRPRKFAHADAQCQSGGSHTYPP